MQSILIIDDDPGIIETYQLALENEGFEVYTASNGAQGLALAREKLPGLILSDIHMPGTDGCSVLQAIRADPNLATKQVVLMTGNPMLVTPRSGMEMGADDFLLKPFTLQDLLRCIEARFQRAKIHWRVEDKAIADLRSSIASTLPHEFFTPLAGVLGLVDILKHDGRSLDEKEFREILCEIEKCGWRLQRTLKNLLMAMEKPDPNRPGLTAMEPEVAKSLIESAVEVVARQTGRGADIRVETEPVALLGVPADFSIVVEELLANACSFSRHATPVVVRLDASGLLTVSEKGRGMSAAQIEALGAFQQFERERFEQQGLGLGLCLVKRICERHGAEFQIESEEGVGTVASIKWPLASGSPDGQRAGSDASRDTPPTAP